MKQELIEKLINKLLESDIDTKIKTSENSELWSAMLWKYVILRGYDSWVHFWKLEYVSKWLYRLSESRRLRYRFAKKWIWLSSVALYWLKD